MIIALVIVCFSAFTYFTHTSVNPVTGEKQHLNLTVDQEIALGVQSAPEMAAQYGGEDPDGDDRALVSKVGQNVVAHSDASKSSYKFQFHALADPQTINAFALPGGQIFITNGLLKRLKTEGQLAGVLGHECGHVIERHSAQQIAKAQLTQGLTGAAVIATYNPYDYRSRTSAGVAVLIGQLVTLKFSRNDELQADQWGVKLMSEAGYDPRSMLDVMQILKQASGGRGQAEFFSTHPNPDNREAKIKAEIEARYPGGVPDGLTK